MVEITFPQLHDAHVEAFIEHITTMCDHLSVLAVSFKGALASFEHKREEFLDAIRNGASATSIAETMQAVRTFLAGLNGRLGNVETTILVQLQEKGQLALDMFTSIVRGLRILGVVAAATNGVMLLNNLYSGKTERSLAQQRTVAKVTTANLQHIKTFFGTKPAQIALTHMLEARVMRDRRWEFDGIPRTKRIKAIFVGGERSIFAHVENIMLQQPDFGDLFVRGAVHFDTLPQALARAEVINANDEKRCFFEFHTIDHGGPVARTPNPPLEIQVGAMVFENGFGITSSNTPGIPKLVLSTKSTVQFLNGSQAPFCENVHPKFVSSMMYHGSGYTRGILTTAGRAITGASIGSGVSTGIAEAGVIHYTHAGLIKLAAGKCIALKFAFPLVIGAPATVVVGGAWALHTYQCSKRQLYTPERIWSFLGRQI